MFFQTQLVKLKGYDTAQWMAHTESLKLLSGSTLLQRTSSQQPLDMLLMNVLGVRIVFGAYRKDSH